MRRFVRLNTTFVLLASAGMLFPGHLEAAGPAPQNLPEPVPASITDVHPLAVDVSLADGGVLYGQVLNASAVPLAGRRVVVLQQGSEVAVALTDQAGHFSVTSLAGGVYEVRCESGAALCRLWAPHTSPPAAQRALLLTSNGELALGQSRRRGSILKGPLPWLVAIGAAIAVPVALAVNLKPATPVSGS